jgi:hypothetical protein
MPRTSRARPQRRSHDRVSGYLYAAVLIYLATIVGFCALIITWAIGLNADVGGLIALGIVGLGILGHRAKSSRSGAANI